MSKSDRISYEAMSHAANSEHIYFVQYTPSNTAYGAIHSVTNKKHHREVEEKKTATRSRKRNREEEVVEREREYYDENR
ncbi:hypothetical protein YC2023_102259 [Brassica napus]